VVCYTFRVKTGGYDFKTISIFNEFRSDLVLGSLVFGSLFC